MLNYCFFLKTDTNVQHLFLKSSFFLYRHIIEPGDSFILDCFINRSDVMNQHNTNCPL